MQQRGTPQWQLSRSVSNPLADVKREVVIRGRTREVPTPLVLLLR